MTRSENDLHAHRNNLRHVHMPYRAGDIYFQVSNYTTGALIKEYASRKDLVKDYPMSQSTFQTSCNRGWFWRDWHNKKLGKVKIQRVFK